MDLHRCSAAGPRAHRKTNEVWGRGSCTRPVEVNHGPLMTSGLVRLIGGCTVYRLGRHRISLASAFLTIGTASSLSRGPKFERLRPEPIAHALHSAPTERRAHTGNIADSPSCVGNGRANRILASKTAGSCTEVHAKASPARSRRCSPALD
jgi:hypothetical protein